MNSEKEGINGSIAEIAERTKQELQKFKSHLLELYQAYAVLIYYERMGANNRNHEMYTEWFIQTRSIAKYIIDHQVVENCWICTNSLGKPFIQSLITESLKIEVNSFLRLKNQKELTPQENQFLCESTFKAIFKTRYTS